MIYSLDLHIITNNQTIINAIMVNIPAKLNAKVWSDEYTAEELVNEDGDKVVLARVRFNEDADRSAVWNWMKNKKDQVVGELLTGSYIRLHTCYHDETPPRGCEVTSLWSK